MQDPSRVDAAYGEAYERTPVETPDEWGDLAVFLDAVARAELQELAQPRDLSGM